MIDSPMYGQAMVQCYDSTVVVMFSNNKFDSMEVPLAAVNQQPGNRDTYRSVKPPDQCVISYNFEHANSLNFTHNLLIGLGFEEPSRKPHSSVATPNKQKLFSIVSQPKRVFRNEATSVSKAYNGTVLPKRYIPERSKPHNNPNNSRHLPYQPREESSKDRPSHPQQDQPHNASAEVKKISNGHENVQTIKFNSPYGSLTKQKVDKARLTKNQKVRTEFSGNITPKRNISSQIQGNAIHTEHLEQDESFYENSQGDRNMIDESSLIRQESEDNIQQRSTKGFNLLNSPQGCAEHQGEFIQQANSRSLQQPSHFQYKQDRQERQEKENWKNKQDGYNGEHFDKRENGQGKQNITGRDHRQIRQDGTQRQNRENKKNKQDRLQREAGQKNQNRQERQNSNNKDKQRHQRRQERQPRQNWHDTQTEQNNQDRQDRQNKQERETGQNRKNREARNDRQRIEDGEENENREDRENSKNREIKQDKLARGNGESKHNKKDRVNKHNKQDRQNRQIRQNKQDCQNGQQEQDREESILSISPQFVTRQTAQYSNISKKSSPKHSQVIIPNNKPYLQTKNNQTTKGDSSNKYNRPNNQSKNALKNQNSITQEQGRVKSKKQIQDEQMDEIEQRVRRQESAKFKKGYFRVGGNKQRQILPFQASIEPLFANNKQSFNQNSNGSLNRNYPVAQNSSNKNNTNAQNGSNNRSIQAHPSKMVDNKKSIDQGPRTNGFNPNNTSTNNTNSYNANNPNNPKNAHNASNSMNNNANSLNNGAQSSKIRPINSDSLGKNMQRDNVKPSSFLSPTQNKADQRDKAQNRDKQNNQKASPSIKLPNNNLTAITNAPKIKRSNQDTSEPKNSKTEIAGKYKPINNEVTEDLSANNQIKGFKIPQKAVSSKIPKISKVSSISELQQRPSGFDFKRADNSNNGNNSNNYELKKKGAEGQLQKVASHSSSSPNRNLQSFKQPNITRDNDANKTSKKMPQEVKQRYSQAGQDARTRRMNMDDVIERQDDRNENGTASSGSNRFKLSPKRTNQSALMGTQPQKSNQKGGRSSEKPLQPTISRQSKERDRKIKKWREAELEQLEKERRQSKKRELSNASREKQSKKQTRSKRKRSKQIDLDAKEEDRFGLFSKAKPKKGTSQQKKKRGTKLIESENQQEIERQHQNNLSENAENSSDSQLHYEDEEQQRIQNENAYQSQRQATQNFNDSELMDDNLERISSIHSSKITEQQEEHTQQAANSNRPSLLAAVAPGKQNLEELLRATEESPSPNKLQMLPLDIQLDCSNLLQQEEVIANQNEQEVNAVPVADVVDTEAVEEVKIENEEIEQKQAKQEKIAKDSHLSQNQVSQQGQKPGIVILGEKYLPNIATNVESIECSNHAQRQEIKVATLQKNPSQKQPISSANNCQQQVSQAITEPQRKITSTEDKVQEFPTEGGLAINSSNNKQQDFFEYNIKEMSKFNQTVNQTINITKYENFDRDLSQYTRAPILSFIYGNSQKTIDQINSFVPSLQKINLLEEKSLGEPLGEEIIDQAINILLSIDHWIIQRIFQPFLSDDGQVGVWLHWHGHWRVVRVIGDNFRTILRKAVSKFSAQVGLQADLEEVLRLISGVRVARLKSSKKRVLSELDYSLNKKHVLKAVTSKNSKWGERMFEVVKVEVSKQGGNVLKLKERSEYFWVKEQKFQQIFQHFLLICTRPSHFWTTTNIASKESHKSVLCLTSEAAIHGSVTLYYPSQQKSSLCFYKQLESKVLKYMGKIEQKTNQNGNLYFEFRMHGTYYLFLQTPADCDIALESTSKLIIGEPEYIVSQTLKNDKCEYVEIQHSKSNNRPASKQMETLEKLREKFINMVSTK